MNSWMSWKFDISRLALLLFPRIIVFQRDILDSGDSPIKKQQKPPQEFYVLDPLNKWNSGFGEKSIFSLDYFSNALYTLGAASGYITFIP